jgi:hypothetical protein
MGATGREFLLPLDGQHGDGSSDTDDEAHQEWLIDEDLASFAGQSSFHRE